MDQGAVEEEEEVEEAEAELQQQETSPMEKESLTMADARHELRLPRSSSFLGQGLFCLCTGCNIDKTA